MRFGGGSVSHNQLIRRVGFFVGFVVGGGGGGGRPSGARAVRCYRAVPVNDNVVGERSVACEAKVEDAGAQP